MSEHDPIPLTLDTTGPRIRVLANTLHLADWAFNLMEGHPDDVDALADVHAIYGRKLAEIRLCKGWEELSRQTQEHVLIHELVHCHMAMVQEQGNTYVADFMSQREYDLFIKAFRRAMEYSVDGIADAFSGLLAQLGAAQALLEKANATLEKLDPPEEAG